MATYISKVKPLLFCLAAATVALPTAVQAGTDETYVSQDILPYGFTLTGLHGGIDVDPQQAIKLVAEGLGSRLSKVELLNGSGRVLYAAKDQSSLSLPTPLDFGSHYTIRVAVERSWLEQSETREINFTTVAIPQMEGPALTLLGLDALVNLHFDRPVADVQATGDLELKAEADATGQNIRLQAGTFEPDRKYVVQLKYKTSTGAPVPPLSLELTTPPALVAETNVRGLTDLGLALPLKVNFSEPLADRANAASHLLVQTKDGKTISGKWQWIGPRQLRFTPQPAWPASSTIEVVNSDVQSLKSIQGGTLKQAQIEQFSTGTDRKLFVYLDKQRVDAVENGKVVRTFKVSTGKSKTPTVTGTFYIYDRYRHKRMRSDVAKGQPGFYEVEDVPYTQFFHRDYAFHGAYWHNNFGQPASHGCVNMATKEQNKRWPNVSEDAGWLYQWGALGLPVTVTDGTSAQMRTSRAPTVKSKSPDKEAPAETSAKQEATNRVVVQR